MENCFWHTGPKSLILIHGSWSVNNNTNLQSGKETIKALCEAEAGYEAYLLFERCLLKPLKIYSLLHTTQRRRRGFPYDSDEVLSLKKWACNDIK